VLRRESGILLPWLEGFMRASPSGTPVGLRALPAFALALLGASCGVDISGPGDMSEDGSVSAPTITISAPQDGATVEGTVEISGTATDSTGIERVELQVDMGAFAAASGTNAWRYTLDTDSLAEGAHTVTARATSTRGATGARAFYLNVHRTAAPGELVISAPLMLMPTTLAPGDTLTGTVTYRNGGSYPVVVMDAVITARPPGVGHNGLPHDDFSPRGGNAMVAPGATYPLTASWTLPNDAPEGVWTAYATYQDDAGQWHDGADLTFTVRTQTVDAGGGDAGMRSDGGTTDAGTHDAGVGGLALHVMGNQLVDGNGNPIHLRGVNRSGTEYMCIQNAGIFDGPNDEASIIAIASWNTRSVRLGLNEDCWLNINGVNPAYAGANYIDAIKAYVALLHKHGLYAELELHWNAPGTTAATGQREMADLDHSVTFWTSVAGTFKNDPAVIFDTYNEPHDISWACWKSGGTAAACGTTFALAGQQQLVSAIRQAGASNVIALGGLAYANDLTGWRANMPTDPLGQLIAEAHIYGGNACATSTCWDAQMAPVAQSVPLLIGELGQHYAGTDCGGTVTSAIMTWADAHGVSWGAWVWDTWTDCLALISNYDGTVSARSTHAANVKARLTQDANLP
jgi:hypothetical protein